MHVKGILPGRTKKHHYRRTVIIVEVVIIGEFYCTSRSSRYQKSSKNFGYVLKDITKMEKYIIAHVLNWRQFQLFKHWRLRGTV